MAESTVPAAKKAKRSAPLSEKCPAIREVPRYQRSVPLSENCSTIREVLHYQRSAPLSEKCPTIREMPRYQRCAPLSEKCPAIREVPHYQRSAPLSEKCYAIREVLRYQRSAPLSEKCPAIREVCPAIREVLRYQRSAPISEKCSAIREMLRYQRSAPLSSVTAEEREKQFKTDFYADGGVLFCPFCEHSVNFTCVDTVKDHLKINKHAAKKESRKAKSSSSEALSTSRLMTLGTVVKSRELRAEFVLDYVKMCTVTDIPLKKTDKIHPFLKKHCKQAGASPKVSIYNSTVETLRDISEVYLLMCLSTSIFMYKSPVPAQVALINACIYIYIVRD